MKSKIFNIAFATLVAMASLAFAIQEGTNQAGFTTAHYFNLEPSDEAKLLTFMQDFNQLFTKLGYPNVKYRLWRITNDTTAQRSYRWDAVWPNRAAYDKVHQDESYKKLLEKHRPAFDALVKDHLYYRLVEVMPTTKGM